jgi:uncharacterized membrane protein
MDEINNKAMDNKGKNTGMAVVAYAIFFLPLLTEAKKDPFVKYHVKQGLVLFLAGLVSRVITYIPFIGWTLVGPYSIFLLVLFAVGVMNALGGKQAPLPLIGKFAEKFKI